MPELEVAKYLSPLSKPEKALYKDKTKSLARLEEELKDLYGEAISLYWDTSSVDVRYVGKHGVETFGTLHENWDAGSISKFRGEVLMLLGS